jgi:ketosteroid isomerase-like protein
MSQENVEMVRAAIDAFNRGDLEGFVADVSSDFEYIPSGRLPDAANAYHGPDEFKRFIGWLTEQFDDARLEVHEFIDADDQVVASVSNRGRGKASGIETSWNVWLVWTLRDGKAVRGQAFTSKREALEAAGLSG